MRFRRCCTTLPELAGRGLTPQRAAKGASDFIRSGLSPTATTRVDLKLKGQILFAVGSLICKKKLLPQLSRRFSKAHEALLS